ncbi:uncharacterized protein LOC111114037 isoform X2 [Crassostrea virginica]
MKNHRWVALNRGNLYLSVVLHRPSPTSKRSLMERFDLEIAGALALICMLHEMGIKDACLKWPNDVWVKGHKLAGFLAEHGGPVPGSDNGLDLFVLGMGINVNSDMRRHPELLGIATSIRCENGGEWVSREKVLADVCNRLEYYLGLSHEEIFTETSRFLLFQPEQQVKAHHVLDGIKFPATVQGLTGNWRMIVRDNKGEQMDLHPSEYSLRPMPSKTIYVYNGKMAVPWKARLILDSLHSVADTSKYFVDALNEEKLTEEIWKRDAVLVVVGELCQREGTLESLAAIQRFTTDGGSMLLIKTKADLIFSNLDVPVQTLNQTSSLCEVLFQDKKFTTLITGGELTFNPDAGSEVIGYYNNKETGSPSAVVTKVGAGKCAVVGFDVEITQNDVDKVPNINKLDEIEDSLSRTSILRDDFLCHVLSKLIH